jgi:stage II sporulation protein M
MSIKPLASHYNLGTLISSSLNKPEARVMRRYSLSLKGDLAYLRSIRIYIAVSVFTFVLSAVLGYMAAAADPSFADNWMKELSMLKWIMDLSPPLIMLVIFLKNLAACAMSVLLGLGLGIMPLLVVTSNGILIGVVSYTALQRASPLFLLAGILPHGIIELPVVLISIAMGFRLGHLLILSLLGEDVSLVEEVKTSIRLLFMRFAPLLFVAAAIETFITPLVMSVVS